MDLNTIFTNTANSIRSKKNTPAKIKPENFDSEISSISSGSETNLNSISDWLEYVNENSYKIDTFEDENCKVLPQTTSNGNKFDILKMVYYKDTMNGKPNNLYLEYSDSLRFTPKIRDKVYFIYYKNENEVVPNIFINRNSSTELIVNQSIRFIQSNGYEKETISEKYNQVLDMTYQVYDDITSTVTLNIPYGRKHILYRADKTISQTKRLLPSKYDNVLLVDTNDNTNDDIIMLFNQNNRQVLLDDIIGNILSSKKTDEEINIFLDELKSSILENNLTNEDICSAVVDFTQNQEVYSNVMMRLEELSMNSDFETMSDEEKANLKVDYVRMALEESNMSYRMKLEQSNFDIFKLPSVDRFYINNGQFKSIYNVDTSDFNKYIIYYLGETSNLENSYMCSRDNIVSSFPEICTALNITSDELGGLTPEEFIQ